MGEQYEAWAVMLPGSSAAREAVDLRLAGLERAVAALGRKVAKAKAGAERPGAVFDGLMEASAELARTVAELEATRVAVSLMRMIWDEAHASGYAKRDAELRAEVPAQREGDGPRRGLHVVRAAS